jgi:hypothetical protein
MNPMMQQEALDVRQQGSEAILANTGLPRIVEPARFLQVLGGFGQNDYPPHRGGPCNRFFNSGIVKNSASPRSIAARRVARTSACQAGDGTASGVRASETHSNSIVWSRSSRLIFSISAA